MIQKGQDRGYNPAQCMRVKLEYVEDGKRSGRPKEISEATDMAVLASVKQDRNGREKSSEILAFEAGISHSSVLRILHKHGFTIVKPSWKPGLTEAAKATRLRFCLDHQHWTLEDWKAVIFTDETSVILGHGRGSVRVWRTAGDVSRADAGASWRRPGCRGILPSSTACPWDSTSISHHLVS